MSDEASGLHGLRRALRDSDDPRAARTRLSLFEATQRLCADGRDVSVSAIVREASVSRSVFYTHFADLGELALRMTEPSFADIAAHAAVERDADPRQAMLEAQRRLVEHFAEHGALYRAAFQLPGDAVVDRVRATMQPPIDAHIEAVGAPGGLRPELAARYIASAATHVLAAWVRGEIEADAEVIAHHLYALMPTWMHERLDASSRKTTEEERRTP